MKEYIILFFAYLITIPLLNTFLDKQIAYAVHVLVAINLLVLFWKKYKLKFRLDMLAITTGVIIFLLWVVLENAYPIPYSIEYAPLNSFFLVSKIIGFILIAPIIEELFIRSFFMRLIIGRDWEKVPIGKYTLTSFIITVLFFGLTGMSAQNRVGQLLKDETSGFMCSSAKARSVWIT